jgi:hypothetical protein
MSQTAFARAIRVWALACVLSSCLHERAMAADAAPAQPDASTPPGLRSPDDALKSSNSFRVADVTLFDGEKIVEQAIVVVKDGWVAQVCARGQPDCILPGLPTIEGSGKFLMPSMIDAEGHFSRPTEMLDELLSRDAPVCGTGANNQGRVLRVSSFDLLSAFADKDLFTEIDTHGLQLDNGFRPHHFGGRYPIAPGANYEKHIRFGVTTVLDMAAYPWPANYVKRSRNQWGPVHDAQAADLKKEFLVYADLYGSGMWAAPAGLQFGFFGMDPVYNVRPDGPWDEAQIKAWIGRRAAEGSDHIKVFYEKWNGKAAPSFSAATLSALVRAHALSARSPGASFARSVLETPDVLPYVNALDEMRIAACGGRDDFERVFHNTAKLYDHGAMLLVGTDAFGLEPLVEGLGVHYEAYLIREALDRFSTTARGTAANLAALKAATSNASLVYGLHIENGNRPKGDPRGFIKPGYRADLLCGKALFRTC